MGQDMGADSRLSQAEPDSLGPSGFDPGREMVLVELIHDDGEHEPHSCGFEAICPTAADARALVETRWPEARRHSEDDLSAYTLWVDGKEIDVTVAFQVLPVWQASAIEAGTATTTGVAEGESAAAKPDTNKEAGK